MEGRTTFEGSSIGMGEEMEDVRVLSSWLTRADESGVEMVEWE